MKQTTTFIKAPMQMSLVLLAILLAISSSVFAQANYWSVFGASGSGCSGSSTSFAMNATIATPYSASFSGISPVNDIPAAGNIFGPFPLAYTTFNATGQPLFSVDINGIYKSGGGLTYDFTAGYTTTITSGGTTFNITAKGAASEICVFPCTVTNPNSSYYAVFWAGTTTGAAVLRAVQINIDASGNLTFIDNILYDASTTNGMIEVSNSALALTGIQFAIATDAAPCGGQRNIYTLEPTTNTSGEIVSNLRKWTFGADGSLPSPTTATFFDQQNYPAFGTKAKILNISGKKYFAYISGGDNPSGLVNEARWLALWDISDAPSGTPAGIADVAAYDMGANHEINGFEHVSSSSSDYIYVSCIAFLSDPSTGNIDLSNSGLAFFSPVARGNTSTTFTQVSGTSNFLSTDLELAKSGNLFMVSIIGTLSNLTIGNPGNLAFLPPSQFGSSSATPTLITSSCSTGSSPQFFSVASLTFKQAGSDFEFPFYLGKQYINEDPQFPTITGVDINTRCAPGYCCGVASPVVLPTYTTSVTGGTPNTTGAPYYYLWKSINLVSTTGGFSPPTDPILNNYNIADPTITGLNYFHSVPYLTASYSLTVTDANGCSTGMLVQNTLITSGFDLASKDSPWDLYDERNNQNVNPDNWDVWHTPDIWNRYIHDGIANQVNESPDYVTTGSTPNYLYVKVRNVGCTSNPGDQSLYTYWTMGGGGEAWPTYWTGMATESPFCTGSTGSLLDGNYANSTSSPGTSADIPPIAIGTYSILSTQWTPPDPGSYYPFTCYPTEPVMELCFLSRIVDGHGMGLSTSCSPDYMTYCETPNTDITANVLNNNNIVTLNTSIATVNALPAHRPHIIIVGSGELTSQIFSLQFANNFSLSPGTGISTLSNYVNVKVYLGPLLDIWLRAGGYGTYKSINPDGSITFDGSNTMRLDSITLDSGAYYPVSIEFDMVPGADGRQMPDEMVNFRQLYFGNPPDTTIDSAIVGNIDSSIVSTIDSAYDSTTSSTVYDTGYSTIYDTVYTTVYDTTSISDTVYSNFSFKIKYVPPPPPCPGVLTVVEMSNGPAPLSPATSPTNAGLNAPQSGCNYGEMLVSGCGKCSSPTANVQGWIIDDNSGNFNISGCTVFGGITQSHYRLNYNDPVWGNVPVGSTIIVYNADSNCYNLPDTFTIIANAGKGATATNLANISSANTYFVPIGGSEISPLGKPHVQRFKYQVDSPLCTYVIDTVTDSTNDSVYYETACEWDSTINFDTTTDAFQVRCPRCGRDISTQPAFYHGFGYGKDTGANQYATIPADANSLGGAVLNNSGAGYKYCFAGATAADLGDPTKWQVFAADAAGSPPATLGNLNAAFATNVQQNNLNLPCCSPTSQHHHNDGRNSNGNNSDGTGARSSAGHLGSSPASLGTDWQGSLLVFPIPATMTLNFQYSSQATITIKLFDVTGRLMDEQQLQNSASTSFDISGYAPGIYLYQVITATATQSGKVLIGN